MNSHQVLKKFYKIVARWKEEERFKNRMRIDHERDVMDHGCPMNVIVGLCVGSSSPKLLALAIVVGAATTGYFPSLRTAHCAASNEDGSLVAVFGGFVNRSSTSDHSVYFLDTKTWIWTVSTSNSVRGRSYSACAFSGNQLIVWGGFYQNPTSTPNNLPSVEESTLVYSLDAQNWVSTFTPRSAAYGVGGSGGPDAGEQDGVTDGELSDPKGKSVGLILAIAAVGAILALVITGGAIMVIRKRNRRRSNSTSTRHTSSQNGIAPMSSVGTSSIKGSSSNIWDQKSPSGLEAGLATNANIALSSGKGGLVMTEDVPPVSGYNTWEHHGPISGHREVGMTTTTMTNPIIGVTQTTIVTTPKNGSKAGKSPTGKVSNYTTNRRVPEQGHEQASSSRNLTAFADNESKDSWSENHQNQAYQSRLEHEFEEKSQGACYPVSVEREYR
ncbi:MAG: hypothetical protein J3Q66DRAFT_389916 [Benniella sp.]|nr:MAG: hypothetical protein J3Q66DRAFT_389916 [Benniella sp.]